MLRRTVSIYILWSVLVFLATASAPQDVDPFCNSENFSSPLFSPNTRVLMDSFHYVNLLPPQDGAVWQQVDDDDNNRASSRTEVSQIYLT